MHRKIWVAGAILGLGWGLAHAFVPQTGTWVVTAENNGKPGRGFGLDVQDNTLVMQMYAYDASGAPTFYLSAGKLANNNYSGQLNQYRGGPSFGSSNQSGKEDGSAGVVTMRFLSGTRGYIRFPNEPEKEITRYTFGYDNSADSLKGFWMLGSMHQTDPSKDTVDFFKLETAIEGSTHGTGGMASKDYQYTCEHVVSGPNAGNVICVNVDINGKLARVYSFKLSVNDGEGMSGVSSNKANDDLFVKRIKSPSGLMSGIYWSQNATVTPAIDPALATAALEAAVQQPMPQPSQR